ncbi:hypothetical protein Poli38472_011427 [Pythium oligandrum]|uniref:Uncharacterized protein n=1 Tax=Pythium oligandrum TaxID=41045 RepID=A0A8K1FM67_PYTOL|nr:hypothetical protein Poli38472_011427 [Pythium oligandrum]|eukprot:TMW64547.1 hypothetical protein Poli38472_011427 [Pythium oligandrum]
MSSPSSPSPGRARPRRTESIQEDAEYTYPVRFEWTQPATESVGITGSFNNWGSQILLQANDADKSHAVTLYLPIGTHFFKFCVDGAWKYDPEVVFAADEYGNLNNFIRVFPHVDLSEGTKHVQFPIRTMLRDSPNGLPAMNPEAAEELLKFRSQQASGNRTMRSPAQRHHSRSDHKAVSDPPLPLVTHLRAPKETQDIEYDLNVNDMTHHHHAHGSTGSRSRSGTLTRSRSEESLAHLALDEPIMPKYTAHLGDVASASVLLAATTQNFGGDLVTHEHNQRALLGGHRSSVVMHPDGTTKVTSKKSGKLALFLVGLPGRGKTYIGHILSRHLTWMGHQSKIFSTGEYRRQIVGALVNHDFWDPHNESSAGIRLEIAQKCLDDSITALESDTCDCVIFDATNATRNRRRMLREQLQSRYKCEVMFIESVSNRPDMLEASINEMKLNSADYAALTLEETAEDYKRRIEHYHAVYEPMDADQEEVPFIKIIDVGRQIFSNQVYGYLQSRIMFLMANLNLRSRPIWLSRHGESMYNTQKRIGGDSPLSPLGVQYAMQLDRFVDAYYPAPDTELAVWTSTMLRTGMTVERIAARGRTVVKWKQLDEIDAGVCDGMTYEQVAEEMPDEYIARKNNKLHYRYPRGESYQDVIHRLEPVIMELMRIDQPVLIVAHQAILRVLYAYLTNKAPSECPTLNIPLHVVIQVTPKAYRCEEVWHRPM